MTARVGLPSKREAGQARERSVGRGRARGHQNEEGRALARQKAVRVAPTEQAVSVRQRSQGRGIDARVEAADHRDPAIVALERVERGAHGRERASSAGSKQALGPQLERVGPAGCARDLGEAALN